MSEPTPQPIQFWLDRLSRRLVQHRLNRNWTQVELARAAGVSPRTVARLEKAEPTQLENFLRLLCALGLEEGLDRLLPEVPESPIQQLERSGRKRRRASGKRKAEEKAEQPWSWGDGS